MTSIQGIITICLVALLLNLPFGWIRSKTRKFSLAWFACVHAPIPFVAAIRILTHTSWEFIPLFLLVSVAGQIIGARLKPQVAVAEADSEIAD